MSKFNLSMALLGASMLGGFTSKMYKYPSFSNDGDFRKIANDKHKNRKSWIRRKKRKSSS